MRHPFFQSRTLWILVVCLTTGWAGSGSGQTVQVVPRSERAPEIRLSGDQVTLPLVMIDEFPFIEGSAAGVKGKFLFDTGNEQALSLNDHRIPLAGAVETGTGHFGSGQTFKVRMNAVVRNVEVGPLRFAVATKVQSQDATQLEAITPDFIGWLGYYSWTGYAFKLDYRTAHVTFYRDGPHSYLLGEKVVVGLPFTTRKLPNHPVMPVIIGGAAAVAAFDTGQYGSLFTTADQKAKWISQGVLKPSASHPGSYDLGPITLAGRQLPGIPRLEVSTERFPAAEPIGLSEPTVLSIGYGFLRKYKTVWDYPRKRIWFLQR